MMSTLSREDNWTADYYLGNRCDVEQALTRSRKRLRDTQRRIRRLEREKANLNNHYSRFVKSGEVKLIK